MVQDTAGYVKRIYKMIKDSEENEKGSVQSWSHQCVYIEARVAEKILKDLMPIPREPGGRGGNPFFGGGGGFRGQFQRGGGRGGFDGDFNQPPPPPQPQQG